MKKLNPSFPTSEHEKIVNIMTDYFKSDPRIFAVVLEGSLARGQAVIGSCVDLGIFIYPDDMGKFFRREETRKRIADYAKMGGKTQRYWGESPDSRRDIEMEHEIEFEDSLVDVDLLFRSDIPRLRNQLGICQDQFDLGVGNLFVYCIPLYERDNTYKSLAKKYLPFYDDEIRKERLEGTRKEFDQRIQKIKWLADRGQLFDCYSQLLLSFKIFLQHLFIKERKYPISYKKWIKYQITDILHKPELYEKLTGVLALRPSSEVMKTNADLLNSLMEQYGVSLEEL